jgi:hypothetical protein
MDECRTSDCEGRVDLTTSPGVSDYRERFCDGDDHCRYVWIPEDDAWHLLPFPFAQQR